MSHFEYEHTTTVSLRDYTDIHALSSRPKRRLRLIALAALGLALLFWSYTLLLGATILILVVLIVVAPQMVPAGMATNYKLAEHLHGPLTFGISESELWVSGENLNLRSNWPNVRFWQQRDGWLRIACSGMQDLYFPVDDLQDAHVYDPVLDLCCEHSEPFDDETKAFIQGRDPLLSSAAPRAAV